GTATGPTIPPASLLGRWREAASDPARQREAGKLAEQVEALLTGSRPTQEKHPDRILFDNLVSVDSPLLQGIDLARPGKGRSTTTRFGLDKTRFGRHPEGKLAEEANLVVPANTTIEVRLPAALFRDHEFVVEGILDTDNADQVVQFQVLTVPPTA